MSTGPKRFNDWFALLLALGIFAVFGYVLMTNGDQSGVIVGACIALLTTIGYHYFRKAPPADKPTDEQPPTPPPHG